MNFSKRLIAGFTATALGFSLISGNFTVFSGEDNVQDMMKQSINGNSKSQTIENFEEASKVSQSYFKSKNDVQEYEEKFRHYFYDIERDFSYELEWPIYCWFNPKKGLADIDCFEKYVQKYITLTNKIKERSDKNSKEGSYYNDVVVKVFNSMVDKFKNSKVVIDKIKKLLNEFCEKKLLGQDDLDNIEAEQHKLGDIALHGFSLDALFEFCYYCIDFDNFYKCDSDQEYKLMKEYFNEIMNLYIDYHKDIKENDSKYKDEEKIELNTPVTFIIPLQQDDPEKSKEKVLKNLNQLPEMFKKLKEKSESYKVASELYDKYLAKDKYENLKSASSSEWIGDKKPNGNNSQEKDTSPTYKENKVKTCEIRENNKGGANNNANKTKPDSESTNKPIKSELNNNSDVPKKISSTPVTKKNMESKSIHVNNAGKDNKNAVKKTGETGFVGNTKSKKSANGANIDTHAAAGALYGGELKKSKITNNANSLSTNQDKTTKYDSEAINAANKAPNNNNKQNNNNVNNRVPVASTEEKSTSAAANKSSYSASPVEDKNSASSSVTDEKIKEAEAAVAEALEEFKEAEKEAKKFDSEINETNCKAKLDSALEELKSTTKEYIKRCPEGEHKKAMEEWLKKLDTDANIPDLPKKA